MKVYVGADWDKEKCVVAWRHEGKVRHDTVKRDPESVEAFVARVREAHGVEQSEIEVGIEAGDPFWVVLWKRSCGEAWVFDGKKVRRFLESLCVSGAHDDRRSSDALLGMVEGPTHRNRANVMLAPEMEALHTAHTAKLEATRDVIAATNRLWALLQQSYPGLKADHATCHSQWFLGALELAPTARAWAELSNEQRAAALKGTSRRRREDYAKRFAADLGALDEEHESSMRMRIRNAVDMLRTTLRCEARAQTELEERLDKTSGLDHIRSIEGVGPVIASGLALAFTIGDGRSNDAPGQQRDAAAIVIGAAPVTSRSGTMGDAAPRARMRRTASNLLKLIPNFLGLQLISRHDWAAAAFTYYRSRGKSPNTAYRCITRSFLRVVQALERDGTTFDSDRYVAALKKKGVPWALAL